VRDNRGITSIVYEASCDRVKSVIDPATVTLSYVYGTMGEREKVMYPSGESVSYSYTPLSGGTSILIGEREPFGLGWTHAYDIRMEDAGIDADGTEYSPRSDFFGGKHSYTRDADGLYTPPPYLFDELDSKYHEFLAGYSIQSSSPLAF
jgi:hypothetical protein